jgi:hypothetical protein
MILPMSFRATLNMMVVELAPALASKVKGRLGSRSTKATRHKIDSMASVSEETRAIFMGEFYLTLANIPITKTRDLADNDVLAILANKVNGGVSGVRVATQQKPKQKLTQQS